MDWLIIQLQKRNIYRQIMQRQLFSVSSVSFVISAADVQGKKMTKILSVAALDNLK